jgi:hypothetical protein
MKHYSPSKRGSLGCDTLLQTTISQEAVGVVGDQRESVLVEGSAHVCLCDSETDGVGDTLTKRTSGDLDTLSDTGFWVTRGDGVDLSECLEVIHGDLVACEVEHDVLEGTSVCQWICPKALEQRDQNMRHLSERRNSRVSVGENESVSVEPLWALAVVGHEAGPKHVGDGCHSLLFSGGVAWVRHTMGAPG